MIILPVPPRPTAFCTAPPLNKNEARNVCGRSGLRFFIKWSDLLCLFRPGGNAEQHKADDKQDGNGAHTHVGAAGQLAAHADDHSAKEGGTLAADIEQTEVFAGFFLRDDLGKVAAAQCLHTALEHTHHHGQHPELPLTLQEEGKDGNAGIGRNAHRDQGLGFIFLAQAAKDQRRREGHDLGDQQRQQQSGGVQTQCRAVGGGHVNDGIHTVDIAEESQQ